MREERLANPIGAAVIQPDQMIGAGQLCARERGQELARAHTTTAALEPRHSHVQGLHHPDPASELGDSEQPRRTGQRRIRRADPELKPAPPAGP